MLVQYKHTNEKRSSRLLSRVRPVLRSGRIENTGQPLAQKLLLGLYVNPIVRGSDLPAGHQLDPGRQLRADHLSAIRDSTHNLFIQMISGEEAEGEMKMFAVSVGFMNPK